MSVSVARGGTGFGASVLRAVVSIGGDGIVLGNGGDGTVPGGLPVFGTDFGNGADELSDREAALLRVVAADGCLAGCAGACNRIRSPG